MKATLSRYRIVTCGIAWALAIGIAAVDPATIIGKAALVAMVAIGISLTAWEVFQEYKRNDEHEQYE